MKMKANDLHNIIWERFLKRVRITNLYVDRLHGFTWQRGINIQNLCGEVVDDLT